MIWKYSLKNIPVVAKPRTSKTALAGNIIKAPVPLPIASLLLPYLIMYTHLPTRYRAPQIAAVIGNLRATTSIHTITTGLIST